MLHVDDPLQPDRKMVILMNLNILPYFDLKERDLVENLHLINNGDQII